MRRWLLISVLVVSAAIGGVVLLGSHKPAAVSLHSQLKSLERRTLKSLSTRPRAIQVPSPSVQGYSCPAAAGSPCGRQPCTVYASPAPAAGNGHFELAIPLRSAPCAQALARTVPAMAR